MQNWIEFFISYYFIIIYVYNLIQGLKSDIEINVEPGLFEWLGWYQAGVPKFMSLQELREVGYSVNLGYQPVWPFSKFNLQETSEQFYDRCYQVTKEILVRHEVEGNDNFTDFQALWHWHHIIFFEYFLFLRHHWPRIYHIIQFYFSFVVAHYIVILMHQNKQTQLDAISVEFTLYFNNNNSGTFVTMSHITKKTEVWSTFQSRHFNRPHMKLLQCNACLLLGGSILFICLNELVRWQHIIHSLFVVRWQHIIHICFVVGFAAYYSYACLLLGGSILFIISYVCLLLGGSILFICLLVVRWQHIIHILVCC